MSAIFFAKRLLAAGLSVVILTAVAAAGAAVAARMNAPKAFEPFTAATILILSILALAVGCGLRQSKTSKPH